MAPSWPGECAWVGRDPRSSRAAPRRWQRAVGATSGLPHPPDLRPSSSLGAPCAPAPRDGQRRPAPLPWRRPRHRRSGRLLLSGSPRLLHVLPMKALQVPTRVRPADALPPRHLPRQRPGWAHCRHRRTSALQEPLCADHPAGRLQTTARRCRHSDRSRMGSPCPDLGIPAAPQQGPPGSSESP